MDLSEAELSKQCNALLVNCLNKVSASNLASNVNGTNLLDLLNPARNSLSYIFVLAAKFDVGGRNALEVNWQYITSFLESFDPRQIKHAQREFRRVADAFCKHAAEIDRPILAVKPLKKAILHSNPSHFSFMHTLFTRLCLQAKCYRDALPVLEVDVFDFPASKSIKLDDVGGKGFEVGYRDVLEFYLYGGMLYAGVKKWRRALDYLSHAIAAPGSACSIIQVEAYKKFVLIGLLLDGKEPPALPKSTSIFSVRAYKALAKPYDSFAQVFKSGDAAQFRQEVELTSEQFRLDGNSGLAAQCMEAFRRMRIIALRDTYVTLGVHDIARKKFDATGRGGDVGSKEETERLILGMIERDEISASLSQSASDPALSQTTVHFDSNPIEEFRNLQALEEQIQRIVTLNKQVKQMDKNLGLTREYIQYALKQSKSAGGGNPSGGLMTMDSDMMELDYAPGWGDEDPEEAMMPDFED